MSIETNSKRFTLNLVDAYKILRGALVTALGTVITYVAPLLMTITYSFTVNGIVVDLSPLVIVLVSALLEAGRRFVADNTPAA